jgi:hypothetical protein
VNDHGSARDHSNVQVTGLNTRTVVENLQIAYQTEDEMVFFFSLFTHNITLIKKKKNKKNNGDSCLNRKDGERRKFQIRKSLYPKIHKKRY